MCLNEVTRIREEPLPYYQKTVEANKHTIEYTTGEATVLVRIFAQTYRLTKGIKKFGNKGLDNALSEVKQLHGRTCFRTIGVKNLTNK